MAWRFYSATGVAKFVEKQVKRGGSPLTIVITRDTFGDFYVTDATEASSGSVIVRKDVRPPQDISVEDQSLRTHLRSAAVELLKAAQLIEFCGACKHDVPESRIAFSPDFPEEARRWVNV